MTEQSKAASDVLVLLAAAPKPAQKPVGYVRAADLEKLNDPRLSGYGMLISKLPEGRIPLYAVPQPAPDARAAVIEECAKVCDANPADWDGHDYARNIRALIGTPGSNHD